MATRLDIVDLRGVYRGHKVRVRYERRRGEWEAVIRAGEVERVFVLDYHAKPCWSVACDLLDEMFPAKPRFKRKRESDRPTLALHAPA